MLPLCDQGLRCIAYDRRGHGRSDDPGHSYEMDRLADDLAQLMVHLDLHGVTLIGQSMGCAEIARYLSRHGSRRIARVALLSPITPCLLQSEDNPEGAPRSVHEAHVQLSSRIAPLQLRGSNGRLLRPAARWPGPELVSPEMKQWITRLILETSPRANIECYRAFWEDDFDRHAGLLPCHADHSRGA